MDNGLVQSSISLDVFNLNWSLFLQWHTGRASINFQIQEVQTSYLWNLEVPLSFFWKSHFFLWYGHGMVDCYPHAFLKKRRGYCNRLRPSVRLSVRLSVRPSRYLLLNHWTKYNQIWCVCCSHEWGVQRHIFFWPRPLGPWGGAKRSNIIKYH